MHLLPPPPPQNTDLLDITYKIRVVFYNDWGASWEALEPIAHTFLKNPVFEVIVLAMPSKVSSNRFYDLGASHCLQTFAHKMHCPVITKEDLDRVCAELRINQEQKHKSYAQVINSLFSQSLQTQTNLLCILGFDKWEENHAFNAMTYLTPSDCMAHYCFTTRPYSGLRPETWHSRHIAIISKLCYVEYGVYAFELHDDVCAYSEDNLRYYDYLFSPTTFHAQVAGAQQKNKSLLTIKVTGCARFDELIAYANSAQTIQQHQASLKPDSVRCPHRIRVLYMPRWGVKEAHSTFLSYTKLLLLEAKASRILLHFRPHPNLHDYVVHNQKIMTQAQWDSFKNDVQQNGLWDESPSIIESFSRADVLVSDTSSMLIYAFLSGKPTIYTQGDFRSEVNWWALRVLQGCFIASNADDLLEFLARFRDDYEATFFTRFALRDEILKQNFYFPKNGSTNTILSVLLEDMQKTYK
ncbi:hypothetical protein [Helicobacter typhlonius]|uniref:hypothetical protein n=1 Tax=Helicobacter typhlonius TaxID=76936 RepID=UPI002FE23C6F